MKPTFLTPGPSELYFTVQDHIRSAVMNGTLSISHRSQEFKNIYKEAIDNLKELLSIPDNFAIVFTSSATEIWERSLQNFEPKQASFFVNGSFSEKFYQCAQSLDVKSELFNPKSNEWDWNSINISENSKLIAIAQNETSIGMATPESEISSLKEKYPDKLLVVDMVSGLPYYSIDFKNWDSIYFSVQKGFGLPAGLGVWIVNRNVEISDSKVSPHRQLSQMIIASDKYQNMETPNVLDIYLLAKVSRDMLNRGLNVIRQESNYKAVLTYQAIKESPFLKAHIENEKYQSKTTIVADCLDTNSENIIQHLRKSGIEIGKGYGKNSENQIRIANFPTHSKEVFELMVDGLGEFIK